MRGAEAEVGRTSIPSDTEVGLTSAGTPIAWSRAMPRKNLIRSDLYPYHLTGRTNNREPFPVPIEVVWTLFEREAYAIHTLYGSEIQSLVLMPNHFHLIATIPEFDLGRVMNYFLVNLSKAMNSTAGRTGHVFGGPYHWTLIDNSRYYGHVFKYVYRNPVKAGLCDSVESYRYSTLHGRMGSSHLGVPLTYTRLGMEESLPNCDSTEIWLNWLNRPFSTEAEYLIQTALRRKKFALPLDRVIGIEKSLLEHLI
jgi:putative transposase